MAYCLDANIFIEGWNRNTPHDVMPGFWTALEDHAAAGNLFSIDTVYREITRGNDKLAEWVKRRKKTLFKKESDQGTQAAFASGVQDAVANRSPAFHSTAHSAFFAGADPWLIAHCKAHDHVLVTEERLDTRETKRIRIPAICRELDVRYVNTWDMMRDLKIKLVTK